MDYKEHFHSLIDEGKYDDAFAYLKRFSGYAYEDAFYFANMGWLYNQFHDYENAKSCLLTGLRVFDDDGWMLAQLGCTYNRCMEYDKGLACFQQALAYSFDEPWIHYEMCLCYRELADFNNALDEIQNALMEQPDHCGYMEECGDLLITMERYDDAFDVFAKAFSLSGEPYYLLMMGECNEKAGMYENALACYDRIVQKSLDSDVHLHKGICYYELHQPQQALEELLRSLELGRDDTLIYQYLGRTYAVMDDQEEADTCFLRTISYYQRALEVNEDRRWLYQEMIDIAALVSSHEILYEILAKALQEYDGEALIRYQAARCYSNDGDYEQSIELIRDTPSDVYSKEFDYLLAHDLGRMQKQAEAIDVLEMLRKNNPEDPWILCEFGWNLAQLEDYDKAAQLFEEALSIEEDAYCEAMLGWCLFHLEQYTAACDHVAKALELGLDEQWVHQLQSDCDQACREVSC